MSDLLELYKEKLEDALQRFYTQYGLFKRKNVTRMNTFRYTVYTENPKIVFSPLLDVIHYAVLIYDNSTTFQKAPTDEKSFMSAIKHVENTIKHTKNPPSIIDLISSTPNLSSSLLLVTQLPQIVTNAELISFWKDISFIPCDLKWKRQRDNYNQHLKGQEICKSIKYLETIVSI